MIDADLLRALGVGNSAAELYAPILTEACPLWGIEEPNEIAAFVANCAHESAKFTVFEENLNYSAWALRQYWPNRISEDQAKQIERKPMLIANAVYSNRMGNGSEESNDGWTFRGRGAIQVTGRDNYEALAQAWGYDTGAKPEMLALPEGAIVSACWFWKAHGCNELAQAGDWIALRKRINGGTNGMAEVTYLLDKARNYLGLQA
jgi:putative chitinase